MSPRRRRKKAQRGTLWPLLALLGAMAGVTALGVYLTGDQRQDDPTLTLELLSPPAPPSTRDRVRVEVLNGGGVRGVAGEARDLLRDRQFDVVFYGNAPTFDRETSLILDRTGMQGVAWEIAQALGIREVEFRPDTLVYADVTVLLGTDWPPGPDGQQESGMEGEMDGGPTPWWDLRRFLTQR